MRQNNYSSSNKPNPLGPYDGILLVDKPKEWTSHDVVAKIRAHFKFKKVGHGGTLDPQATGLLVILVGRGTKLSQRVMGSDKTYEGTMLLGVATDSQDADGEVTQERDASFVTRELLEAEMKNWVGDIMQIPPMVSAIKKDGVPLYKMARKGKTIEREPRPIHIYEFSLIDFNFPYASFRLRSTKGTYVRTVCADVGEALGCGAHLSQLHRTRSGALDVKNALSLDAVLALSKEDLAEYITPIYQLKPEDV